MKKAEITVQMLVKNEDRFIWYAISSILPFADKVIIFDTGSEDKTVEIIQTFGERKIIFSQKIVHSPQDITLLRQKQLEITETDWFWIVDGDEIYPFSLGKEIREIVRRQGEKLVGIVVRRYDLLGDIYHYQKEEIGSYQFLGKKGHLVLRLINQKNIKGLHLEGIYPNEGYYDGKGREIITYSPSRYYFTKGRLFHAMYLQRSSLGGNLSSTLNRKKWKIETGLKIPSSSFPEVFNFVPPSIVPQVIFPRSFFYELVAFFLTPLKNCKRKIFSLKDFFSKEKNRSEENFDPFGLEELQIGKTYVDWIYSLFQPFIGEKVLEVGSGLGLMLERIQEKKLVIGSDINPVFLAKLRKKFHGRKNIKIIRLDITKIPSRVLQNLQRIKITTIIAVNTLEHIKEDFLALKNLHQILAKGGFLLLFVPALPTIYGSLDKAFGHFRRYSKKDLLSALQAAGFNIKKVRYFNFFGIFWWIIAGKILRRKTLPKNTGRLLKFIVPILQKIEGWLGGTVMGQSLIIIAQK